MSDDPILDAKTVDALMVAIDAVYDLDLPTQFPDGTVLATIWASGVAVAAAPRPGVLYQATGTVPLPITVPPCMVIAEVVPPTNKEQT